MEGSPQDIPTIDPAIAQVNNFSQGAALYALYDPLVMHVGNPPRLVPVLAQDVPAMSDDGLTWTVRLNPQAKFQDGSPVTSAAVKYSLARMLRISKGASFMWRGIVDPDSIETPDPSTAVIRLTSPFTPFPQTLPALVIVNPAVVDQHLAADDGQEWLASDSAGSGPFRIKRWQPGELYEFEADPEYWRGWQPEGRLSGFIWRVITDPGAAKIALQTGEVHSLTNLAPVDVESIKSDSIRIEEYPGINCHRIVLHNMSPNKYTADVNVRRAMTHAFDQAQVLDVYAGHARPLKGPVPPDFPGSSDTLQTLEFSIDKARAELAKSPWPSGGFSLEYMYPDGIELAQNIGLILLSGLSQINVELKLVPTPTANFVGRRSKPDTMADSMSLWLSGQYIDADTYLFNQYYSANAGAGNYSYYSDPEVDGMLEDARAEPVEENRDLIYAELQQKLIDEAVDIFTTAENSIVPFRNEVGGYEFTPTRPRAPYFRDLWIED